MAPKKTGLGKGLGALLPSAAAQVSSNKQGQSALFVPTAQAAGGHDEVYDGQRLMRLELDRIIANPDQPRVDFSEEALAELAESVRVHGIIQPIAVTPRGGKWMIVAGERRWRAARVAELETIPAVEVQCDDRELLELALVENLQRQDLNAIEEARAYQALHKRFSLSQDEIALAVGKARSTVTNALRLLRLAAEVQTDISEGRLSAGHARAVLMLPDRGRQLELRDKILRLTLNVRQAEAQAAVMAKRFTPEPEKEQPKPKAAAKRDANVARLREQISQRTACKVEFVAQSPTAGRIELHYSSLDELDRILAVLGVTGE